MNIRHLTYFVTAAEEQSISRAAEKLNMTQPSLSRQIRSFEDYLGWSLFNRGAKSIELTHEGSIVLKEGKAILRYVKQAEMRVQQQVGRGLLRIGYSPTHAEHIFQYILPKFTADFPDIRIQLNDLSSNDMRKQLIANELDLIIDELGTTKNINWLQISNFDRIYAVPEKHPLAKKKSISLEEIHNERLILFNRLEYSSYWESVTGYFIEHKINAKLAGEFDGIDSLTVALNAGLGVAIVSSRSALPEEIVKIPGKPPLPKTLSAIGTHASIPAPPHLREFIQYIQSNKLPMSS